MSDTEVINPGWANAEGTAIDCGIVQESSEVWPFTASMDDVEAHGRELFERLVAGEFGEISPYVGPSLDQLKRDKADFLNQACRASIYAGFSSYALGDSFHYPAKDKDQTNLAASVVDSLIPGLAEDWTTPFWCCDVEGQWIYRPHSAAQIQQVGRDGKAAILKALARNAELQAQVAAAKSHGELEAIQWLPSLPG